MSDIRSLPAGVDRAVAVLRRCGAQAVLRSSGPLGVVVAALLAGTVAALALLGARSALGPPPPDPAVSLPRAVRITTTTGSPAPPASLVVHVAGAVRRPGLVTVPDGARVAEVLDAAGGLVPDAETRWINLAEKVGDGGRLYVPLAGEHDPPPVLTGGSPAPGASGAGPLSVPIDLNTAGAAELDELPGVGPATAAAIVEHRERQGRFATVDALADVRGIGPAKLESLRPLVRV